jgi:hypothetical protein
MSISETLKILGGIILLTLILLYLIYQINMTGNNNSKTVEYTIIAVPQTPSRAGLRYSQYGCGASPDYGGDMCQGNAQGGTYHYDNAYAISIAKNMSGKFSGSSPTIIYIIGYIKTPETTTYLSFPHSAVPNVMFDTVDRNEANLQALDAAGINYWLQVEPASANMSTLIDLVYGQYWTNHSSHIIGFGVDAEWWHVAEMKDGRPVTDEEANQWQAWVKAKDSGQKLFIKHFNYNNLPATARPADTIWIDDTQLHSSYKELITDYAGFVTHFSGYPVGLQIGYPSDKPYWSSVSNPAATIYNYE